MSVANRLPRFTRLPALLLAASLGVIAAAVTPSAPRDRGSLPLRHRRSEAEERPLLHRRRAETQTQYAISPQSGRTPHPKVRAGYSARNVSQGLTAHFGTGEVGITITRGRDRQHGSMELVSWGRQGARRPALAATPQVEGNRVEYVRGPLREWYVNDENGIEQGFTVAAPPVGAAAGHASLELDFQVSGELLPVLAPDQQSIRFLDAEGTTAFQYSKLKAWDSHGNVLPSRMSVEATAEGTHVRLAVNDRGATYPLTIDPLITAETVLAPGDGTSQDRFGFAMNASGNTLVVGSPQHDLPSNEDAGAVYVYVRDEGGWRLEEKLTAPDPAPFINFGSAVSIDVDTIVVGAPLCSNGVLLTGAAYVFTRASGTWTLREKLIPSLANQLQRFGGSVDVSGGNIAVGSYGESHDGIRDAGAVYLYEFVEGNWLFNTKVRPESPFENRLYGYDVALEGTVLVVGSPNDESVSGSVRGAVYVYIRTSSWEFRQRLPVPNGALASSFGTTLGLGNGTLAIGAPHADRNGADDSGTVYAYAWTGTEFIFDSQLFALGSGVGEHFGWSVEADGDRIAVGAFHGVGFAREMHGTGHLFRRLGGSWREENRYVSAGADERDLFGSACVLASDYVAFGAMEDEENVTGMNTGTVYPIPLPPTAPITLSTTPVSVSETLVEWIDTSNREDGFEIYRKTGSMGVFGLVSAVGPDATSYSDAGLAPNTTYAYRVRAFNAGGVSDYSGVASVATPAVPPLAPSTLVRESSSATHIGLRWTDNSTTETGFRVERSTDGLAFAEIATPAANAETYSDTTITDGVRYFYRVRAVNTGGYSSYSNTLEVGPPGANEPRPGTPDLGPAATVSASEIELTWTPGSGTIGAFHLERKQGSGSFLTIATTEPAARSYLDSGLLPATTYTYRLRASNDGGFSGYSSERAATTQSLTPPAAPANLSASVVSSSIIRLEWEDRSDNESSFRVERSTDGGASFNPLAQVGANVPLYRDSGLAASTHHIYRVKAFNGGGASGYSNLAYATTLPLAPAAPTGLTANPLSSSEIAIQWTDASSNESGFRLERRTASASFAQHALFGTNTTTFRDRGLDPNTTYTYRLCALNAGGESAFTDETSATTRVAAPEAPSGLTAAVVSETTIDLTWIDRSANETGFEVERKVLAGPYARVAQPAAGVATYRDASLAPNTTHVYRVRAVNTGGASGYSEEATGTTLPLLPEAPTELTVTALSSSKLRLDWTDASESETGFRIERAPQGSDSFGLVTTLRGNSTSYRDEGREADTTYRYRVRAFNARGESPSSGVAEGRTLPQAPTAPSGLSLTVLGQTMIEVHWSDQSSNETGFEVERKTGPASGPGAYALVATVAADGAELIDGWLAPETQYTYRVRAVNAGGPSAYTAAMSAQTQPAPPAAPGGLAASPLSTTAIRITWDDQSNNETGFEVERRIGSAAWTRIATPAAGSTSYDNTGLSAGVTYSYRVRAVNSGGASAFTLEASTSTYALNTPTKLVATRRSTSQIKLTWADGGKGENGFAIERRTGSGGFAEIKRVGANVRTFTDTRLTRGTSYVYRVRAFKNPSGFSAYSNEAAAVTAASIGRGR